MPSLFRQSRMASRRLVAALAVFMMPVAALYINGSVTAPCDSPLYCQGDILKAIELAQPFPDSKTFPDMPTTKPLDEVMDAYSQLSQPLSNSSELNEFLAKYFLPAGGELESVNSSKLDINPTFLDKVNDTVIKEFVTAVMNIWPDLTRKYADSNTCDGCVSSFVPLNRTFVVAGGRFREAYYWDSFWIIEGLLRTKGAFTGIAKNIIENFLDLVETIGFVPNGSRLYYLNRSQPPLLAQMVQVYIEHTKDIDILERALPLLIQEHQFFMTNRTVKVKALNGTIYTLNRYHVDNNQPRPESYYEDWTTANNKSYYSASGVIYPQNKPLNGSAKAELYAELASGAESGWDYGTRWLAVPSDAANDVYFPLRSLNIRNLAPVDLNSILYMNEVAIAKFLNMTGNSTGAQAWQAKARERSEAMYAVLWNETLSSYFDYNLTSGAQNIYIPAENTTIPAERKTAPPGQQVFFNVAQFYPFWTGAAPAKLREDPEAVRRVYSRVSDLLDHNPGGVPATNYVTGQQWDEPNVWPPLQYVLMKGLLQTASSSSSGGGGGGGDGKKDPSTSGANVALAQRIAQRYLDSTFCTWMATGGSTSETPRVAGASAGAHGIMFEKYADSATDAVGAGGEYTVVEGFGWSNGVLIWTADTFAGSLRRPDCGNITAANVTVTPNSRRARRAVELDPLGRRLDQQVWQPAGRLRPGA